MTVFVCNIPGDGIISSAGGRGGNGGDATGISNVNSPANGGAPAPGGNGGILHYWGPTHLGTFDVSGGRRRRGRGVDRRRSFGARCLGRHEPASSSTAFPEQILYPVDLTVSGASAPWLT